MQASRLKWNPIRLEGIGKDFRSDPEVVELELSIHNLAFHFLVGKTTILVLSQSSVVQSKLTINSVQCRGENG